MSIPKHPSWWYSSIYILGGIVFLAFGLAPETRMAAWLGLAFLALAVYRHYVDTYTLTNDAVEANHGIIARNLSAVRIRDIRSIGVRQGVLERLLGIGSVIIASAATDKPEVILKGVAAPEKVRRAIEALRDRNA